METRIGLKILVADDSTALRQRLKKMISAIDGVETVTEAEDGTEALELMRTAVFDAAILDIRMPGSSGLEVLQEIRKALPSLVIIMLTNYPYLAYRVRSSEIGANFFFDKNSEFTKVLEVLDRMAKHRRAKAGAE